MSAFNTVELNRVCPNCRNKVTLRVQFKYGDMWQHVYHIGDRISWGGNDNGKPGAKRVVVDGAAEPCPVCGFDDETNFEVCLEDDRIVAGQTASEKYDFVRGKDSYLVLEQ